MTLFLGVVFSILALGAGIIITAAIIGGAVINTNNPKSRLKYIETCVLTLSAIVLAAYVFTPVFLYHAITAVSIATITVISIMDPEELLNINLSDII
jgi:hypothetical protein